MKRHTRIISTLGPSTRSPESVRALIEAGIDFARLNFSHGLARNHIEAAHLIRETAKKVGREVKILQDLQGPKFRIDELPHPLHFRSGDRVTLASIISHPNDIPVATSNIIQWIRNGDRIFLDDGAVELEAIEIRDGRIDCTVKIGGRLDSRSGIQIQGQTIGLPALSQKDLADIEVGRTIPVDVVAQSMVRNRADVDQLKSQLGEKIPIIAKIENAESLRDLERITQGVWGVMVARGDLGVSIPRAQVPLWQKEILAICQKQKRFGIVATDMLQSMVKNERPTRAEVSDVATAILDGANAVMLSEETAIGTHPIEAVREMREIIETVEASQWYRPPESGIDKL